MTLRYSPAALRDLDQLWDEVYAASQDMDTADRYLADLLAKLAAKSEFPHSGSPLTYEGNLTGLYYVVHKEYLAFYRVTDAIEVARVIYSRRDYMKILFRK